jgi:hypothetical protein
MTASAPPLFGLDDFGQDVRHHQCLIPIVFDGGRPPIQRDDADVGTSASGIGIGLPGFFFPTQRNDRAYDADMHGALLLQRDPGVKHGLHQV